MGRDKRDDCSDDQQFLEDADVDAEQISKDLESTEQCEDTQGENGGDNTTVDLTVPYSSYPSVVESVQTERQERLVVACTSCLCNNMARTVLFYDDVDEDADKLRHIKGSKRRPAIAPSGNSARSAPTGDAYECTIPDCSFTRQIDAQTSRVRAYCSDCEKERFFEEVSS